MQPNISVSPIVKALNAVFSSKVAIKAIEPNCRMAFDLVKIPVEGRKKTYWPKHQSASRRGQLFYCKRKTY